MSETSTEQRPSGLVTEYPCNLDLLSKTKTEEDLCRNTADADVIIVAPCGQKSRHVCLDCFALLTAGRVECIHGDTIHIVIDRPIHGGHQ